MAALNSNISKGNKNTCPLTTNPQKRATANRITNSIKESFPSGIGQPALRTLASAGYLNLDQLTNVTETELKTLHGMGPKALQILRVALQAQGKSFLT